MPLQKCAVQKELIENIDHVLARIVQLTTRQRELFQLPERQISMEVDRDLENTVGEKERLFGALRQHRSEHGC